jgi:peroxiredoxin Q/BCP
MSRGDYRKSTIAVTPKTVNLSPRLIRSRVAMNSCFNRYFAILLATFCFLGIPVKPTVQAAGPAVGDAAPDFNLPIVGEDDYLSLKEANESGPVVVIVLRGYPGYQCPLCSQQVGAFVNRAAALAKVAKKVILIYPGEASMLDKHAEEFVGSRSIPAPIVIVRDPDMKMITEYGLRWSKSKETAYPAAYVIDKNGRIRWSKISDSHAGRASVDEVITELGKL